jgi:chemotaxis methyl-accepting protein methylase
MFCNDNFLLEVTQARSLSTVLCVGSGLSTEPHALAVAGLDVTALDLSPFAMEWARQVQFKSSDRFFDRRWLRDGGKVRFVVGDLMDPSVCPGPYDLIIERKTLQLFPDEQRQSALAFVLNRLSDRGVLLTHCHDGCWKPPGPPRHHVRPLLTAAGMRIVQGQTIPAEAGRFAIVFTSTG